MIILDDQARQQMTLHFQLSLQCNVSPVTGFVRHTAKKKKEVATYILVLYDYGLGLLPGLCGLYLIEEHNHKRFKSLGCSLRIAYDFSDALKTHLNVCRVCCPLNDQIR